MNHVPPPAEQSLLSATTWKTERTRLVRNSFAFLTYTWRDAEVNGVKNTSKKQTNYRPRRKQNKKKNAKAVFYEERNANTRLSAQTPNRDPRLCMHKQVKADFSGPRVLSVIVQRPITDNGLLRTFNGRGELKFLGPLWPFVCVPARTRTDPPGYREYPGGTPFDQLYWALYISATQGPWKHNKCETKKK